MTDPIADLLTQIRNAYMVNKKTVSVPHSSVKLAIAETLKQQGYIMDVAVDDNKPQPNMLMKLKYIANSPVISRIKRVSKPGRRVYSSSKQLKTVLSGHGISIISTSQGIMTNHEARKRNLGGEVICQIW